MRTPDAVETLTAFEKAVRALAFSGKSPDRIAAELGTSKAAVQRALTRSTSKLRYEVKGL
jgi:DNA-binding NarL/FixJ family response regulator